MHKFANLPEANISRSSFNRNHGYKTTFNAGDLVPIFCDEVLPGDTYNLSMKSFARLATPVVPVMDGLYLDTFFFFVPYRLVWDHWREFCGERREPEDNTSYVLPRLTVPEGGFDVQSIYDYMGIPPLTGMKRAPQSLPFRAYNLIYNEWFRDENLEVRHPVPRGDGPDAVTDFWVARRGKRHDYFTSSLPWPQKSPGIDLPLGTTANVYGNGSALMLDRVFSSGAHGSAPMAIAYDNGNLEAVANAGSFAVGETDSGAFNGGGLSDVRFANVVQKSQNIDSGLYADLSEASMITINDFRNAMMLQQLLEIDARGGTRYRELILAHFGVHSPDARLQVPEYLGGTSGPISFYHVPQTSATDSVSPQGKLSAFATYADDDFIFSQSFTEHGVIIGLVCARADLTYQQGVERQFLRETRYDFYWPTLAHLGEQEVLNEEIFADGSDADLEPFGYQERYAEYRYKPSKITGKLRSVDPQSLDVWHYAQDFSNRPVLNYEFIRENPPIWRSIAVQNEPQFIFDAWFELNCVRPMPVYGIPGFQSHF